jgi:ribosome-binding protein aMBF1 (putative translation factor)
LEQTLNATPKKGEKHIDKNGRIRYVFSDEDIKRGRDAANEARRKASKVLAPQRKRDLTGEKKKIIEDTTDRLKNLMVEEGVSYSELARRLDMSQGHISHMMSGSRNMTLGTLSAIGEVLGYRFTIIPHKIEE